MHPTQLIKQMRQADPEALQYVYDHCKVYCIRRLCSAIHCSPHEAEDIFMDAILIFRENVMKDKLKQVTHLRAYLYQVCKNLYHERQYRSKQAREAEDAVRHHWYEDQDILFDDFPQKKELVMEAFRYLGENCRRILRYYYFEHLSLEEIAQKMDLANVNVAKATKSRCYKRWVEAVATLKQKKNV